MIVVPVAEAGLMTVVSFEGRATVVVPFDAKVKIDVPLLAGVMTMVSLGSLVNVTVPSFEG